MTVRVAVLGAGGHSSVNHGPALARCVADGEDVTLAAVCDLDEGRAASYAAAFGFERTYTDLDHMLATEDLDGLVAITPMEATEALAIKILRAQLPVIIEKPPGVGAEATQRLLQVARQTGTPHMVSFNRRFCPALLKACAWMEEAGVRPRLIIGRMLRHQRLETFFARDTGIHLIDCVLSLTGAPQRVETVIDGGKRATLYSGRLLQDGGPQVSIQIAPDSGTPEESVELLCDDARIELDFQHPAVRIDNNGERVMDWSAADEGMPDYEENGSLGETRAFLQGLRQLKQAGATAALAPDLAQGLLSMQVADAFQQGICRDDLELQTIE
ncbi:MAG: Gfo/Idh/MocA family oxidoreductase [Gemmatimonadetes bacterium]|jgi:predicted dehydrogenase|nr:Gfo/Idh/MocA family oxidoreductase [Gemmatimonadota bacterium]MBT6146536.1 Gfo/Idh/MocA family oxidoreductase [Gemmatimonadota bacterium]MBT7862058.1 Gfo/Idh/MocA family oxidoreductase [Gemmatimonadota bacterium]